MMAHRMQKKSDFLNKLNKGGATAAVVTQVQQPVQPKQESVVQSNAGFAEEEQLKQNIEAEKSKVQDL